MDYTEPSRGVRRYGFSVSRMAGLILLQLVIITASLQNGYSANADEEIHKITGVLEYVDIKKQIITVMENSRLVRFRADKSLCEEYTGKIKSEVEIYYIKENSHTLRIVAISPVSGDK